MSTLRRALVRRTWPNFFTFQLKKPKTQKARWLEKPGIICKYSRCFSPNPRLFQMIPFQSWNRRPMQFATHLKPWPFLLGTLRPESIGYEETSVLLPRRTTLTFPDPWADSEFLCTEPGRLHTYLRGDIIGGIREFYPPHIQIYHSYFLLP